MLLQCEFCKKYVIDRHIEKTDMLWLRTVRGKDHLVCQQHRGGKYEKLVCGKNSRRICSDKSQGS